MESITVVYLQGENRRSCPEQGVLLKDYTCSDEALHAPVPEGYALAFFQDGKDRYLFSRPHGWKKITRSESPEPRIP
ncbi:hypothetical protein [Pseudoduganella danionis]|jgi:hypothetical protein|uniref:hypothetical protein n=1 Tax=Pseudoduganella danionis TaxID=1890295 RepID=UPI0035B26D99